MSHRMGTVPSFWHELGGSATARWGRTLVILLFAVAAAAGWLALSKSKGPEALADASSLRKSQMTELTESLTRSGHIAGGVEAHVILTTPDFFRLTRRSADAKDYHA